MGDGLDLGAVFATVGLATTGFDASYRSLTAKLDKLGALAADAAAGFDALDAGVAGVGRASTAAAASVDRASKAMSTAAMAEQKAAAQSERLAVAKARVADVLADSAGALGDYRVQALRALAADERLAAASAEVGSAAQLQAREIARLATAEASAMAASDRLAKSQMNVAASALKAGDESKGMLAGSLGMAKDLGLVVGALAAAKAVIDIGKDTAQFDASMVRIRSLTGASTSEINSMRSALLGLSGKVAQSPEELATALYHAEAIGLRGAKALDLVTVAAKGASIGGADLESTTNALTSTVASGIAKNQSYASTMNDILTIVGSGDMKLTDFNEALSTGLLAKVAGYGVTLKDVGAALATFGDQNMRGAQGATALRMVVESLAKPSTTGIKALNGIGLAADDLRKDMQSGGLNKAMLDLNAHLKAAGVTGSQVGGVLLDIFSKKGSQGVNLIVQAMERFETKFGELDKPALTFQQRWSSASSTVSFKMRQVGDAAKAEGITIAEGLLPAGEAVAGAFLQVMSVLGSMVKQAEPAISLLGSGLHLLGEGAGAVFGALGPIAPVLGDVAVAAAVMFGAFKGYQVASAALTSLRILVKGLALNVLDAGSGLAAWGRGVQATFAGNATAAEAAALKQTAASTQVEAAQAEEAAAVARAKAQEADAYAAAVAASDDATAQMISNSQNQALAAQEAADSAEAAAAETATAAQTASDAVVAAGDEAALGWGAIAGPLGIAAVGVATLVTLFHHSSTASKEATDAAKAYTDALSSGKPSDVLGAITDQLSKNDVPQKIDALNKALGSTQFSGKQFVTAISNGGPALSKLSKQLTDIITQAQKAQDAALGSNSGGAVAGALSPLAQKQYDVASAKLKAASKLLSDLDAQQSSLSKDQKTEIAAFKQLGSVVTPIQNITKATGLSTDTVSAYAQMAGIAATKSNDLAGSSAAVSAAVSAVSHAYNTATAAGSAFLDAWKTFAGTVATGATAADRAAFIGATLKAANGDALGYAAAINAGATATHSLVSDITSAAQSVGKSGESVRSYMDSILKITTGTKGLTSVTIDYSKSAAAPLISDLQSMQTAAMNAAQAQYQHSRATMNGKDAADAAYTTYQRLTSGALVAQARQLGISDDQAKALAKTYFGMPSDVKTLIEQEGKDKVVDALDRIGELLANLTGQPWTPKISAIDSATPTIDAIKAEAAALAGKDVTFTITAKASAATRANIAAAQAAHRLRLANSAGNVFRAYAGGGIENHYPQIARTRPGTVRVWAEPETGGEAYIPLANDGRRPRARLIAQQAVAALGGQAFFADGGITHRGRSWYYDGIAYASERAAENARTRHTRSSSKSSQSTLTSRVDTAVGKIGTPYSPAFQVTDVGIARIRAQLHAATVALNRAVDEGLSAKTAALMRAKIHAAAQLAAHELAALKVTIKTSDLKHLSSALTAAMHGSTTNLQASVAKMITDLRHAGVSGSSVNVLSAEERALANAATVLAKAKATLASDKAAKAQDVTTFRSAFTSGFDITSAGADADGHVTGGAMEAQSKQALTRARAFYKGLESLAAKKVFPADYLRELASKGPDALPQVQGLLSLDSKDLAQIASDDSEINRLGKSLAGTIAGRLDNGQIAKDQTKVASAEAVTKKLSEDLAKAVEHSLSQLHLHAETKVKGTDLLIVIKAAEKHAKHHRAGVK